MAVENSSSALDCRLSLLYCGESLDLIGSSENCWLKWEVERTQAFCSVNNSKIFSLNKNH